MSSAVDSQEEIDPSTVVPVEDDEPKEPSCPYCYEHRADPAPSDPKVRPSPIFTPGEIVSLTKEVERDKHSHQAHVTGLLHWYSDLDGDVRCGFPDRRAHRRGYVIRTLCDQVINVGHVCGAKHIVGLRELINYATKLDRYAKDLQLLKHEPAALREEFKPIGADLAKLTAFRGHVESKLSTLATELRARASSGGLDVTMTIDGEVRSFGRLTGMELWATHVPATSFVADLSRLDGEIGDALREATDLPKEDARRLAQRLERCRREMNSADTWARSAMRFFDSTNFARAVIAARVERFVEVAKEQFIFTNEVGQRRAIGIGGLFEVR